MEIVLDLLWIHLKSQCLHLGQTQNYSSSAKSVRVKHNSPESNVLSICKGFEELIVSIWDSDRQISLSESHDLFSSRETVLAKLDSEQLSQAT